MKNNHQEAALRMLPSHPEYKKVEYLLALLAAAINPEVHFNFNEIVEAVKRLPIESKERTDEEEGRKNLIQNVLDELEDIFKAIKAPVPAWIEFINELDMDDLSQEADDLRPEEEAMLVHEIIEETAKDSGFTLLD